MRTALIFKLMALLFWSALAKAQSAPEWCRDFTAARGGPADVTGQGATDIAGNPIEYLGACPLQTRAPVVFVGSMVLALVAVAPAYGQARFDVSSTTLAWYWTPDPNAPAADQFNVKCGTAPGSYSKTTAVLNADQPYNPRQMPIAALTDGVTFGPWFCAVTTVAGGVESPLSIEVGLTLLPAAPSGLSAVAISSSTILLTWSNNDPAKVQSINVDRKYQVAGA